MVGPKNLVEQFNDIADYFSPKVIGEINDVYVKVAIIKGDEIPLAQSQG